MIGLPEIDQLDVWISAKARKRAGRKRNLNAVGIECLRTLICDLAVSGSLLKSEQNWKETSLEKLGQIQSGNSLTKAVKKKKYSNGVGRPYLGTTDVGYGFEELNYETGVNIPHEDSTLRTAKRGSVLICSEGGSAGRKCGIAQMDIAFGNKLYSLTPGKDVSSKFLLYFYKSQSFIDKFDSLKTGIIGGVGLGKFRKIKILTPSLKEQKLIVDKVDQFMELIDNFVLHNDFMRESHTDLISALLDSLLESQNAESVERNWGRISESFSELFTTERSVQLLQEAVIQLGVDGFLTPHISRKTRQVKPLEELVAFGPKNGFSPRSVDFETNVKSLSLSATTSGKFDPGHSKYVDIETPAPDSELWLKTGDILIQRANSFEYVGVSAIYDGVSNEYIYPDLMMKIKASEEILPEYFLLVLQSKKVREYFRENASGTSGSMPKINQKVVKKTPIPLISRSHQENLIELIGKLVTQCNLLVENIRTSEALKVELAESVVHYASAS